MFAKPVVSPVHSSTHVCSLWMQFIMMVLFAIVCWPCGALIWCCARKAGNSLFEAPFRYYVAIKDAIPF